MSYGNILSGVGSLASGIGSLINASNGGSGLGSSNGIPGSAPNLGRYGTTPSIGAGAADLFGFFSPIGNELKGLGITNTDFQPVTGLNFNTPGYGASVQDTNGTITGRVTQNPNVFRESLPGLMTSFGDIASGAKAAGEQFLDNVTGGTGNNSPLLAPLNEIEMAREKATSDIEGSLAERGLAGSSFANSAIANSDATFGNAASQAALQLSEGVFNNQLQTLNARSGAIKQQSDLANQALAREIQQLQLEGTLGADVSSALTRNSSTLAQLAAAAAAGRAHALANAGFNLGPLIGSTFGGLGRLFGGNYGPGAGSKYGGTGGGSNGTASTAGYDTGSSTPGPQYSGSGSYTSSSSSGGRYSIGGGGYGPFGAYGSPSPG